MSRLIAFTLVAMLAGTSLAAARPSTLTMSCAEAAATVAKAGAIVLTTGAHTYDRFVAHDGMCMAEEQTVPARAPTLDSPQCSVGYVCQHRELNSNN